MCLRHFLVLLFYDEPINRKERHIMDKTFYGLKTLAYKFHGYPDYNEYRWVQVSEKTLKQISETLCKLIAAEGCTIKSGMARTMAKGIAVCSELDLISCYNYPEEFKKHKASNLYGSIDGQSELSEVEDVENEKAVVLDDYDGYWMVTEFGERVLLEIIDNYSEQCEEYKWIPTHQWEGFLKRRNKNACSQLHKDDARQLMQDFLDNKIGGRVIHHDFRGRKYN